MSGEKSRNRMVVLLKTFAIVGLVILVSQFWGTPIQEWPWSDYRAVIGGMLIFGLFALWNQLHRKQKK